MALVIGIHAEGIIILQYLRYFCDAYLLSTIGPPTRFVFPIFSHVFLSIVAHSLPVVLRSCEDCEIAGAPPPVPCNVTSVDVTIPFSGKATVTTSRVQ